MKKFTQMALTKKTLAGCILSFSLAGIGCSSNTSSGDPEVVGSARDCDELEPENPYSPGSGHYAGFEWAEQHEPAVCGGNSSSFIEGCQAYQEQTAAYESCLSEQ